MGHCIWAYVNDRERRYHDTEWGVPVHDDRHMFEHLTLENLQCGLSWDLMLKKRDIKAKANRTRDNRNGDRLSYYCFTTFGVIKSGI